MYCLNLHWCTHVAVFWVFARTLCISMGDNRKITNSYRDTSRAPILYLVPLVHRSPQPNGISIESSVLDSGTVGPGFKSQSRRCRITVSGKLFTPMVPLFTKQRNWVQTLLWTVKLGWMEQSFTPHSTQYRSFRRRSSQPITWLILTNKPVQENTVKQTQYKSEKVNK